MGSVFLMFCVDEGVRVIRNGVVGSFLHKFHNVEELNREMKCFIDIDDPTSNRIFIFLNDQIYPLDTYPGEALRLSKRQEEFFIECIEFENFMDGADVVNAVCDPYDDDGISMT